MKAEALRGHLDLLVLSALESGPLHGYVLIGELRQRSEGAFDLPEGTVYPALHRLERAGLLTSRWMAAGGRRRRVYQLSRKGKKALADERRAWRDLARGIELVLERAG
jgi:PadR family transcriptional regulator, regulatory protein PadR